MDDSGSQWSRSCVYLCTQMQIEAAVYSYDQFYARFFVPLVFYFISHLLNLTIS